MPRPQSIRGRSSPERTTRDDVQELFDGTARDKNECELCESTRTTSVEYGMRVCRACERELLP